METRKLALLQTDPPHSFRMALILIAAFLFSVTTTLSIPHFRMVSFNIRYDTPSDKGNAWPHRKHMVGGTVSFLQAPLEWKLNYSNLDPVAPVHNVSPHLKFYHWEHPIPFKCIWYPLNWTLNLSIPIYEGWSPWCPRSPRAPSQSPVSCLL